MTEIRYLHFNKPDSAALETNLALIMNSIVKKWLVRPLLILFALFALLSVTAFIILSSQQEKIVKLAVDNLNKHFKGELFIAESNISLFKNFPHVSIVLNDGRFYADKEMKQKPIWH